MTRALNPMSGPKLLKGQKKDRNSSTSNMLTPHPNTQFGPPEKLDASDLLVENVGVTHMCFSGGMGVQGGEESGVEKLTWSSLKGFLNRALFPYKNERFASSVLLVGIGFL